jgi:pimeloyl-ACP methyl ester carboxylesterase
MTEVSDQPLPAAVATALANPREGRRTTTRAAGIDWSALEWGPSSAPAVLLIHGVTSAATTWWRIGPAIAAAGYSVIAVDLPGHGMTRPWIGHHRFRDNAQDVAALIGARTLPVADLAIVGHSWGAMTVAALPLAGVVPRVLVLVDPPALRTPWTREMLDDPVERKYDDLADAESAIRGANPQWTDGDIRAKAEGLTQFDEVAVRAVLLDNGVWDGGIADLTAARDALRSTWVIRGDPDGGSLTPDDALPSFADLVGADHIVTIAGAPHSPHRMFAEAFTAALLRAIEGGAR